MNFPILTFDEAKLAPSWGYVFDARWLDPCESMVSMLWKLVWINRLAGHSVVTHVARRSVDPYVGIGTTLLEIDGKWGRFVFHVESPGLDSSTGVGVALGDR